MAHHCEKTTYFHVTHMYFIIGNKVRTIYAHFIFGQNVRSNYGSNGTLLISFHEDYT